MNDSEIIYASITEISAALQRRQISSVELTKFFLGRLEQLGPALGALAYLTRPEALVQAEQADRQFARQWEGGRPCGPLVGIPYAVKDLFSVAGSPTEWGCPAYTGQIFDYDCAVVERLRGAGAILLGKLSMIELAGAGGYRYASASSTGVCRSPWNPNHWAGGTSSGPAAATAAGLVPFAIGSETWSSLITPASFCGVSCLRPTVGRVSRFGMMPLSVTMDKVGMLTRTAADCGLVLQALAGPEPRDPSTLATRTFAPAKTRKASEFRVGVIRPDYGKGPYVQPETAVTFENALDILRTQRVETIEISLPDLPVIPAASTVITVEGSASFESLIRDQNRLSKVIDPEQQGGLLAGLVVTAVDYLRSLRLRQVAMDQAAELFAKVDALVSPGQLQIAPPVAANLDNYFTGNDRGLSAWGNLVGLPAVCVPMGYGAGHLPLSLQFVGPAYSENDLLSLAAIYQSATNWHIRQPPAPYG